MSQVGISAVVPVYGSEKTLEEVHRRLSETLPKISPTYEIIFVDDASPDGSWRVLEALAAEDPHTRIIQLMKNAGQQRAVLCGFAHARGELVVTLDDDLQQPPEEILVLHDALVKTGNDVIIGRYRQRKHGLIRRLGTRAVKETARITQGIPRELEFSSFRIVKKHVADEAALIRHSNPVVGFLLHQVTSRIGNVEVSHEPRRHGQSSYSARALVDHFLCMVIDYSDLPLRFVGYLGFLASMFAAALGAYYSYRWLAGTIGVSGWTSIVLFIQFFSGLILMSLGIIGSYLIRILRSSNHPVMYRVRQMRGGDSAAG